MLNVPEFLRRNLDNRSSCFLWIWTPSKSVHFPISTAIPSTVISLPCETRLLNFVNWNLLLKGKLKLMKATLEHEESKENVVGDRPAGLRGHLQMEKKFS